MEWFPEIDSTNTYLRTHMGQDFPEGHVVVADYQSCGRGRWGATWQSSAGKSLLFSVLLRPSSGVLSQLAALFGVACRHALGCGSIKWPNDVWMGGRKVSGLLLEGGPNGVVLGVGLNVNQESGDFPPELKPLASSLFEETGRIWDREELLAGLLQSLEYHYERWTCDGFAWVRPLWERDALWMGEKVRAGTQMGRILGLSDDGGLLLETEQGPQCVQSGEVERLRPVLD